MPLFLKIVVEVKATGLPLFLVLRLGVSKGTLPVMYVSSNNVSFVLVKFYGDDKTITKLM